MRLRPPRSVRGRLLAATVALVAIGLVVADVATYGYLNSFLVQRVDQELRSSIQPVARELNEKIGFGGTFGPPGGVNQVPPGTYGAFLGPNGHLIAAGSQIAFGYEGQHVAPPVLPPKLPGSTDGPNVPEQLFTTGASGNSSTRYRVIAVPLDNSAGTLVVAIPLNEVAGTLHRLLLVELLVTGAVLVLVGGLALWLVQLGLRPLQKIGETAGAIAAGDLSRRVDPAEESTEVGRLGLSLNVMLGQIEQAFAQQRASEERLRRFVADASHELRTPLTSIRGYAELFRRGASTHPGDLAKAMKRIEAEASRMGVLVEDLLLLARLDQGLPVTRERVDLASLASRAVEDARAADPSRTIEFRGNGPVVVQGDELRLKQVLDNLLANARMHTPPGTAAHVVVSSNGEASVDVADEGPGIPSEVGARIFERFYRADSSRSREKGGAGLGLAIASEIARAHGGTLTLVPTETGATFRLSLPAASETQPEVPRAPEA